MTKKHPRKRTSITVRHEDDQLRLKYGIKLSSILDTGFDVTWKRLGLKPDDEEEETEPKTETSPVEKKVIPKPSEPTKKPDDTFSKKFTPIIQEASERYKISGAQYDSPFEDDTDFVHFITLRSKELGLSFDSMKVCVIGYSTGALSYKDLEKMDKDTLLEVSEKYENKVKEI